MFGLKDWQFDIQPVVPLIIDIKVQDLVKFIPLELTLLDFKFEFLQFL